MCNKIPHSTYVLFMLLLFSKCVFSNKLNCESYKKDFAKIKVLILPTVLSKNSLVN